MALQAAHTESAAGVHGVGPKPRSHERTEHGTHAVSPALAAKLVPASQAPHAVDSPDVLDAVPGLHGVQALAPALGAKLPASHLPHVNSPPAPTTALNLPAAHAVHATAATPLYHPAWHCRHEETDALKVPAAHAVHAEAPAGLIWPVRHGEMALFTHSEPAVHRRHAPWEG